VPFLQLRPFCSLSRQCRIFISRKWELLGAKFNLRSKLSTAGPNIQSSHPTSRGGITRSLPSQDSTDRPPKIDWVNFRLDEIVYLIIEPDPTSSLHRKSSASPKGTTRKRSRSPAVWRSTARATFHTFDQEARRNSSNKSSQWSRRFRRMGGMPTLTGARAFVSTTKVYRALIANYGDTPETADYLRPCPYLCDSLRRCSNPRPTDEALLWQRRQKNA